MKVVHIYVCPTHVYVGHHGQPAGTAPMEEVQEARLIAGRGIEGDRYSLRPGTKGQVTFFSEEAWLRLCREFNRDDRGPDVFRRNIIVSGADIDGLVGREFDVQGVRFLGVDYCAPCHWMDHAFAPGAFELLKGWHAGGLRAHVLSDGCLTPEAAPCLG
jgi:MOSC domain-containing protein YiiM